MNDLVKEVFVARNARSSEGNEMNKTLEGMVRAYKQALAADHKGALLQDRSHNKGAAMGSALLFLADNVTDEMVGAYLSCKPTNPRNLHNAIRESISAALRAAAGSAPTTPEGK